MKRKIIACLIAASVAAFSFGVAACKNTDDENFNYAEITENGKITGYEITGVLSVDSPELTIPKSYKRKPVLKIADNSFSGNGEIVSVTIPDSVIEIGEKAFFDCAGLESVSFGNGITQIGNTAFGRCEKLEKVNVSDLGVWCNISFGNMSSNPLYFAQRFYIDNLPATELAIPDSVTSINDYAFYECSDITTVTMGDSVTSIGVSAFYNCEALTSVTVGGGVTSIGDSAFLSCINLEALVIGNSVKDIAEYAFYQCYALNGVEIPSSVESIGGSAFSDCINLKSVTLNDGLKTIGEGAFGGCVSLKNFIMPNSVTEIGYGILMFGAGGVGFGGEGDPFNSIEKVVMSDSITEIPNFAFSKSNIESIEIGKSVETVTYSAFYGCGMLKSVVIPTSVKRIESYAFYNCPYLEKVYYAGSLVDWLKVSVGRNNDISSATRYYYSETQPASGNYWHYVDGVVTEW